MTFNHNRVIFPHKGLHPFNHVLNEWRVALIFLPCIQPGRNYSLTFSNGKFIPARIIKRAFTIIERIARLNACRQYREIAFVNEKTFNIIIPPTICLFFVGVDKTSNTIVSPAMCFPQSGAMSFLISIKIIGRYGGIQRDGHHRHDL